MTLVTHRHIPLSANGNTAQSRGTQVDPVLFVQARKDSEEPLTLTGEPNPLKVLQQQVADLLARDEERAAALANIAEGVASLLDSLAEIRDRLDQ